MLSISMAPLVGAGTDSEVRFQVFRLSERISEPFQERLLSDGATAIAALKKLPDLIRLGDGELLAEINETVTSGERAMVSSSDRKLEVNEIYREVGEKWEVTDGLEIEMDPLVQADGTIDLNMAATYSARFGREVKLSQYTGQTTLAPGIPKLIARWQEEEDDLFFIALASSGGGEPEPDGITPSFLVNLEVYPSENAANSGEGAIAHLGASCVSGQRAKLKTDVPLIYELDQGGWEVEHEGELLEIDPVANPDGTFTLDFEFQLRKEIGGTERDSSGQRVPRMEILGKTATLTLPPNTPEQVDLDLTSLLDAKANPSEAILVMTVHPEAVR